MRLGETRYRIAKLALVLRWPPKRVAVRMGMTRQGVEKHIARIRDVQSEMRAVRRRAP